MFCLTTNSTHFIYGYIASDQLEEEEAEEEEEEEEGNVLFNDTFNTFFVYGYMVSDIIMFKILLRDETRCRHFMGYTFRVV